MPALGKRQRLITTMTHGRTLMSEARRDEGIVLIEDEVGGILVERSTALASTELEETSEIMEEIEIINIYLCVEVKVAIRHVVEKESARASMMIVDLVRGRETEKEIETTEVVIDMKAIEAAIPEREIVIATEEGEIECGPIVMIVEVEAEVLSVSIASSLAKAARKVMIIIGESVEVIENGVKAGVDHLAEDLEDHDISLQVLTVRREVESLVDNPGVHLFRDRDHLPIHHLLLNLNQTERIVQRKRLLH